MSKVAVDLGTIYYRVSADTSGLVQAESAIERVGASAARTGKSASDLGAELQDAGRRGKTATDTIERGAVGAGRAVERAGRQTASATDEMRTGFAGVQSAVTAVGAAIAVLGLTGVAAGLKDTIIETEKFRGALVTATGSIDAANAQFEKLTKFAEETPFTLQQSIDGFIRLKNLGLDPSERALRSYGNTSAAMGKDLMQMIEAVADAATGEFERLKEFGIRASSQGEEVKFTFQGVTTTVRKEAAAIEEYLMRIGEVQFATAMADQMERIPGMLSNLEDAVDGLWRKLGDEGATSAFGASIQATTSVVESLTNHIQVVLGVTEAFAAVLAVRLVQALGASTAAALANASALGVLNSALGLLGGPAGLFAVSAYGVVRLASAMESMEERTKRLRGEIASLTEVQLESNKAIAQGELEAAQFSLRQVERTKNRSAADMRAYQAQLDRIEEIQARIKEYDEQLAKLKNGSAAEVVTATESLTEATEQFNEKSQDLIQKLAVQRAELHMNERAAAIFQARLAQINAGAGPEAVDLAGRMAAALYDEAEAQKKAAEEAELARERMKSAVESVREAQEKAAKGVAQAHREAARQAAEDYREMRDDIGDAFADMVMSGQSAADILKNTFKRTAAEIAGDFLAAMTLDFLGGNPTGKGFSLAGSIANAGTAGKIIMAGAKKFLPGLFSGSASTAGVLSAADYVAVMEASGAKFGTAAGAAGAGGSTGLLGGLGRAIGSIPPWGWALAGGAVLASMFDKKSTPSYNAGLLLHDLPTLEADRKFAVAPFESGLTPVGFNRRTTQEEADQVVEYFRQIDSLIVNTAKTFDKIVSADLVRGFDERGLGSGIFLGAAREDGLATTPVDQQGVMFARQLIESLRGQIEDADLGKILAETTVEGMVATLQKVLQGSMSPAELAFKQYVKDRLEFFGGATTGALKDIERKAKDFGFTLEDVARITGYSADRVTEAFARINSSLGSAASAASSAAQAMATSLSNIKDYISQAVSASDALIREQIRQRETYYRELMRQEEQLHNRRLRLFQSLQAYTSSLRTGDMTILSPTEQLEAARSEFQSLASVVTNTSLSQEVRLKAAEQLQSAADTYLREGRDYYASSEGYKEIFDEVMQALEAAKFLGTNQEYDGSALENQMLEELQKMNAQLGSLPQGIGAVLGPMLASLIGQALAAGHDARYTANTIASLGPEAVEAGNKPFQQAYGKTIEEAATTPEQAKIALEEIKALGMNEVDTIKFIVEKAKSVGLSSDRVGELLGLTPEQVAKNLAIAGIPAFAKGGRHKGGLALVGEEGPELVDLGPSTIYTASDTQRILSVVQEIANTALGKNTRVAAVELLTKRDPEALLQATAQAQDGGLLMERTADLFRLVSELKGSGATVVDIPAFAKGGYHTGGLALVGEEGPELVRMGPSQVFTAHETREILRGSSDRMGGLATEELMREVIIELRQVKDMLHRLLNAEIAGGSAAAQQREAQIKKLDDIGRKLQPAIGGSRKYVG